MGLQIGCRQESALCVMCGVFTLCIFGSDEKKAVSKSGKAASPKKPSERSVVFM